VKKWSPVMKQHLPPASGCESTGWKSLAAPRLYR